MSGTNPWLLPQGIREVSPAEAAVDLYTTWGYDLVMSPFMAASLPGHGQGTTRGGRCDAIGRIFGHARSVAGISADLKALVSLSLAGARDRRSSDILRRLIDAFPGQEDTRAEMGCERNLVQNGEVWDVTRAYS